MPTVFYAWQSDTPNSVNRGFIRKALDEAVAALNQGIAVEESLEVDQDTQGVPGSPPIAETILRKIDQCDVFVGDVTFVGATSPPQGDPPPEWEKKLLPNPNVMVELGYCLGQHGHDRLITVMNEHFGPASSLPFDLSHRRFPMRFSLAPDSSSPKRLRVRAELAKALKSAISSTISNRNMNSDRQGVPEDVFASPYLASSFLPNGSVLPIPRDQSGRETVWRNQPQVWLRIIPTIPLNIESQVKLKALVNNSRCPLRPLGSVGQSVPITDGRSADGYLLAVTAEDGGALRAINLTKLFSSGELWGVEQHLLRENNELTGGKRVIPTGALKRLLEGGLKHYLQFTREVLEYKGPVRMIAGLDMIEGIPLVLKEDRFTETSIRSRVEINQVITELQFDPAAIFIPLYEDLWDACAETYDAMEA